MLLFLTGYMGCGKSTVGRKLAHRLEVPFIDTDAAVEQREGASVCDIFRYEGEEHFRRMERSVIDEIIASGTSAVVSTGGGLPLWSDNMECMNAAGITVYIDRSAEVIARRLSPYGRQKRPRLRGLSDERLIEVMQGDIVERAPFYRRSTHTLRADTMSDESLVDAIRQLVTR